MGDGDSERRSGGHSLLTGFESWSYLWRFCTAVAAILRSLAFSTAAALRLFGISIATKELTISASGEAQGRITGVNIATAGLSFRTADDRSTHIVFVPANKFWVAAVREAYLDAGAPDDAVSAQIDILQKRWDASVGNGYMEVFFEDNSGFFIVIVELCATRCA